jgi:uncharacterized protein
MMQTDTAIPQESDRPPTWKLHPLLAFALSTAFVILVVYMVPPLVVFLLRKHPIAYEIASRGIPLLVIAAGYYAFVRFGERANQPWDRAIALPLRRRSLGEFVVGSAIAGAMVTTCVLLIFVFGSLELRLNLNIATLRHTAAVLTMTLIAALLEELMFRGYPFQRLATGVGNIGAIILFSILFGAIHLSNPNASRLGFVNTIAIGIMFAIAYFRSGSLWLPFGLHFGWNFVLGVIFGLPVSGLMIFATFMHGTAHGPRWLTGGAYGIEASATATAIVVLSTILLIVLLRPERVVAKTDQLPPSGIQ